MRLAKFNDGWRRIQDLSNYNCQLLRVSITDIEGITNKFSLELNNGVSAICGKNGVGKSTILKAIYSYANGDRRTRLNDIDINISALHNNNVIDNADGVTVNYIEPSVECNKIISFLNASDNIDDFIEGLEPNGFLGKRECVDIIGNIIGRSYSKIEIYEVEGALSSDYTFPFIKVVLPSGVEYSCLEMGAGEYLCMYIFWFVNWIDTHSILLIDEIENCISVYSQEYLMDYLAYVSSQRGLWVLLSSHSESILHKVGIENIKLISNVNNKGISVVSPKHERKYFTALGIKPRKKGVFIVEDKFSYFFLSCALNRAASNIAYDYHIVSFKDGESDIEKVVKHFNPNKTIEYSFFAVFDADMRAKIRHLAGKTIPVISLPSIDGLNPEKELWITLANNIMEVAHSLGVELDDLSESYEHCAPLDHHDRFMSLSRYMNVSEEVLFNAIFSVWFSNNSKLLSKFIFSIIVSVSGMKKEAINILASEMGLEEFQFNEDPFNSEVVFFDGRDLLLK